MKHCLDGLIPDLLDPQARCLAETVQWWDLDDQSFGGPVPVAVVGDGPTLLLLHGFDSSFLEFRRLAPLISGQFRLIIPDLFGFGFSPRPRDGRYGPSGVWIVSPVAGAVQDTGTPCWRDSACRTVHATGDKLPWFTHCAEFHHTAWG